MSGSSKNKSGLWYGYLEAGDSSSPVVRDQNLETGNAKTLYLFNLARGKILEYQREIVESKLRELKPAEAGVIAELDAAFPEARRNLNLRATRALDTPQRGAHTPKARASEKREEELEELADNDGSGWIADGDDG